MSAATPFPSTSKPNRRCSVPTWLLLALRASATAASMTILTRAVGTIPRTTRRGVRPEHKLEAFSDVADLDPEVGQHPGTQALPFAQEPQQHVLSADAGVIHTLGLLLRERQHVLRVRGELLESKHG